MFNNKLKNTQKYRQNNKSKANNHDKYQVTEMNNYRKIPNKNMKYKQKTA